MYFDNMSTQKFVKNNPGPSHMHIPHAACCAASEAVSIDAVSQSGFYVAKSFRVFNEAPKGKYRLCWKEIVQKIKRIAELDKMTE